MTTSHVPGAPCWVELFTGDTAGATAFYTGLFGWTAEESTAEYGGYIVFRLDDRPVAGCMQDDGSSGAPPTWSVYLESNDAADTAEMVKANGGQVHVEPMQVGEMGHMAFCTDPSGAAVGIWQPLEHKGFGVRGVVGAPTWFELHTVGYEDVIPFYENAFGWVTHTAAESPEFRYTTLGVEEDALAGIMDDSVFDSAGPSYWTFYVQVDDTDATLSCAVELGGVVQQEAEDTPYGRLATVADPAGIPFKVMGPHRES
ncbi:MAG: VOC family protein [Actinomycetota bacterium]|nr:VOC family protein [Actinomycetota bacterium]